MPHPEGLARERKSAFVGADPGGDAGAGPSMAPPAASVAGRTASGSQGEAAGAQAASAGIYYGASYIAFLSFNFSQHL